jgi:hypothetical protein
MTFNGLQFNWKLLTKQLTILKIQKNQNYQLSFFLGINMYFAILIQSK